MGFIKMSNISYKFKLLNTAEQLIIINIVAFITQLIFKFLLRISNLQIFNWLGINNHFDVMISRIWTLLTYSFVHHNFSHIFWNMLLLYFVGTIFFNLFKRKLFLKIYLLGALGGSLFFLIGGYFLMDGNYFLVGASASIMSILFFLCTYVPNYQVTLPFNLRIKLWIFGMIIIFLDIIQMGRVMSGGSIAHLGGALVGCFYALQIKGIFSRNFNFSKKKRKTSIKKTSTTRQKHINPAHQEKIDSILDKISKSGYESLSKTEKEFLFKAKDEF